MNSDGLAKQAKSYETRGPPAYHFTCHLVPSWADICCRCKRFNLSAITLLARVGWIDVDWMPLRRVRAETAWWEHEASVQPDVFWWDSRGITGGIQVAQFNDVYEKIDIRRCTHSRLQCFAVFHKRLSATAVNFRPNLQTLVVNWTKALQDKQV